jgi:hypothetical protein
MVAKLDLSARFPQKIQKQAMQRSQGRYDRNVIVSIDSRSNHFPASNHSTSRSLTVNPTINGANTYSEAVAHNVQRKREKYCRAKATESIVVIAVNLALSIAAIAAIAKLLPYQSSQKDRLDDITTEVNSVEQRVNGLREKLPQTFNSGKSQEMLLRKQGWIKNNQMTIKLIEPSEIASPNNDGVMPTTTTAQKSNTR